MANNNIKKIAIIGAGPMALSLAFLLLKEKPVVLVVRNTAQSARLLSKGIQFKNEVYTDTQAKNLQIVSSIQELSQFNDIDLIFIATKSTALDDVCNKLKGVLKEHTFVISYQNGFNTGKYVIDKLQSTNVLRMVLYYGAALNDKNEIDMIFSTPPHLIGALQKEHYPLAKEIALLLSKCNLNTLFKEDIEPEIWKKSILNASTSPICALTRSTIKEAMNSPSQKLICRLLQEGIQVAEKENIKLPDNFYDTSIQYLSTLGNHYPSMVMDVLNHTPTEITQLNEQICAIGKKHDVPTIANEAIVSLIQTIDFKTIYTPI